MSIRLGGVYAPVPVLASTLTEVSQFDWPRGLFSGRFDTRDILAYAVGLATCYVMDRRFTVEAGRVAAADRESAA